MLSENVKAWDGLDLEADANATTTVTVDPQYWGMARDRNLCVIHFEVLKVSGSPQSIEVLAEDSAGRIFTPIGLTGNSRTTKGLLRITIKDFSGNLKISVKLTAAVGGASSATISLEYCLKSV